MTKLGKIMMGMLFAFILALGISAQSNNAQAATTKNFKGNLNATYKNSEWKCDIVFEKVNSKKVSIYLKSDYVEGDFVGRITSKNTIKMVTGSEFAKVSLKWTDKTHLMAIWKEKNQNIDPFIRQFSAILGNTKYTQVKKSTTVYYAAAHTKRKDEYNMGAVYKMILK